MLLESDELIARLEQMLEQVQQRAEEETRRREEETRRRGNRARGRSAARRTGSTEEVNRRSQAAVGANVSCAVEVAAAALSVKVAAGPGEPPEFL